MEEKKNFVQGLSAILEMNKEVNKDESLAMQKAFHDSEKEQFDEFLLDEGLVAEDDLLKALSQYYQTPAFDVGGYFFDRHLLRMFPKDFLLREAVVPVEVDENIMSVVVSDPNIAGLESMIRDFVSYDITLMVGLRRNICDAVKEFYDKSITEVALDKDLRKERQEEAEERQEELLEDQIEVESRK